jgi:hypothetical protein
LIVETQKGATDDDLTTLKNTLAPNSLFYLPARAHYAKSNFAKKTGSGSFLACGNIVITDRKPFFAPFDITVPSVFSAVYNREITVPANGKVANATIMLPFTISTDADGRHTSDGCTFTLNKLNETNCLSIDQAVDASATNYIGNVHFTPISGVAAANTPYMVKVETAPGDATLSFVISQSGSDIIATPKNSGDNDIDNYVFTGETGNGNNPRQQLHLYEQSLLRRQETCQERQLLLFRTEYVPEFQEPHCQPAIPVRLSFPLIFLLQYHCSKCQGTERIICGL